MNPLIEMYNMHGKFLYPFYQNTDTEEYKNYCGNCDYGDNNLNITIGKNGNVIIIWYIVINPTLRRKGIWTNFIQHIINTSIDHNVSQIRIMIPNENMIAWKDKFNKTSNNQFEYDEKESGHLICTLVDNASNWFI